jgi:hypothetical protein
MVALCFIEYTLRSNNTYGYLGDQCEQLLGLDLIGRTGSLKVNLASASLFLLHYYSRARRFPYYLVSWSERRSPQAPTLLREGRVFSTIRPLSGFLTRRLVAALTGNMHAASRNATYSRTLYLPLLLQPRLDVAPNSLVLGIHYNMRT